MFRRLIAFLAACALFMAPLGAQANLGGVLDQFSSTAVSVNSPGRFNSSARSTMTLGGFEMRMPAQPNTPALFSFAPPRLDTSCSGIDAFFGGFSFISGKQFEQLLKNISSGVALGFVAHLALKTLCPQCEAVVQLLQRLNQIASMAAMDACKFGQQLAQAAMQKWGVSNDPNAKQGACETKATNLGFVDDMMAAMNSACKSIQDITKTLDEDVIAKLNELRSAGVPPAAVGKARVGEYLRNGMGNQTWLLTGEMFPGEEGILPRHLVLNILGTVMSPIQNAGGRTMVEPSCDGLPLNEEKQLYCAPVMTPQAAIDLFMCGVRSQKGANTPPHLDKRCMLTVGWNSETAKQTRIRQCTEDEDCMTLTSVPFDSATFLKDYKGLVFQVNETLMEAVRRVTHDEPLYKTNAADPKGARIVGLIQAAPFPLYQAINAAAVYPAASMEILDSLTVLVAEQLAISYFQEVVRVHGRTTQGTMAPQGMMTSFQNALGAFSDRVEATKVRTATNIAVQEGINQSIRSLNQAIQRQVMSEDLFGANQFGRGLAGLVRAGVPKQVSVPDTP